MTLIDVGLINRLAGCLFLYGTIQHAIAGKQFKLDTYELKTALKSNNFIDLYKK